MRDPRGPLRASLVAAALLLAGATASAQLPGVSSPATGATAAAAAPVDPLGRTTPRGTVFGFLAAARNGDTDLARRYLETSAPPDAAADLAHQLFVVLDLRLPARLTQVSDLPEGSRADPRAPDEERIGTIEGPDGAIDVILVRTRRGKAEPIWLFSPATLAAVPDVYDAIQRGAPAWLPTFMRERRVSGVRLYEWIALLLGLPAFYFLTVLLNRVLTPAARFVGRRLFRTPEGGSRNALPMPARLLLLSVACRWITAVLPVSLMIRQALTNLAVVVAIGSLAWLAILALGEVERTLTRRIAPANYAAAVSLLRVARRLVDVLVLFMALLGVLRHFGVNPTPLLAGLGVGGIAVALAAQKTLENVIAGASLIFDQAVRVGDFLRLGTLEGTVEHIGLRSTRIRTLERTLVSVPNGQIANMSVETLSARDKFWFHPVIGLRYETTTDQMRLVLDGVRQMLARQTEVDGPSIRVRFLRLNAFSLDVEVFAYAYARDWPHFLEIQEALLLKITELVSAAGTGIAFPSQTMYVESANSATPQLPIPK